MTYIDLVNNFWQKDTEHHFSTTEIALYFYILKAANVARWKNPLGLSNALTMAQLRIGKTSFDTAKNNLKRADLIDFEAGNGRNNVYQYWISNIKLTGKAKKVLKKGTQKHTLSPHLSDTLSDTLSDPKPETSIDYKEEEQEKDSSEGKPSGAPMFSYTGKSNDKKEKKGSAQKKESEGTEYWQSLVKVWFDFNEQNLRITPSFKGSDPRDLKQIADILKKRAIAKNFDWTEQHARDTLLLFLKHCYADDWLKNHFLLSNLLKQFDTIIPPNNGNRNSKNGQPDYSDRKAELARKLSGAPGKV